MFLVILVRWFMFRRFHWYKLIIGCLVFILYFDFVFAQLPGPGDIAGEFGEHIGGVGGLDIGDVNQLANEASDKIMKIETADKGTKEAAIAQIKELKKEWIANQIQKTKEANFTMITATMVSNALRVYTTQLAQKAAQLVASGLPGGKPAVEVEPIETILGNAADAAAGEFISSVAKRVLNRDICGGTDFGLRIVVGLADLLGQGGTTPAQPRCTFSNLVQAWDVTDPAILDKIQIGFIPGAEANDLFRALDLTVQAFSNVLKEEETARFERLITAAQGDFKAVKDPVTKIVKTPGSLIKEEIVGLGDTVRDRAVHDIIGNPIYDSINVFASTLIDQIQDMYFKEGLVDLSGFARKKSPTSKSKVSEAIKSLKTGSSGSGRGLTRGIDQEIVKQSVMTNIRTAAVLTPPASFDFISELVTCPEDAKSGALYNCALPQMLKIALDKRGGEYLTVEEAIIQKILPSFLVFAYKDAAQGVEPTILEGLPFSGIVKLRKARIVPVGWEIAGRLIRQRAETKNLGQLMDEFDNRGTDGICNPTAPDEGESPYCNLVDPQWILRAPAYNCKTLRYGQLVQPKSAGRFEYCADIQDCVVEDEQGNCKAFAYCAKEKNVWRLKGDTCNPQFETCWQFSRTSDNENFAYLRNTLDIAACNAGNAGCRWYSIAKDAAGEWISDDVSKRLYFNKQIKNYPCSEDAAGCSYFLRFANTRDAAGVERIIKAVQDNRAAGDGYSNYDQIQNLYLKINTGVPREQNPLYCSREFVGCEKYTPLNGDPSVTAIISNLDRCPRECVGYDSYIQEPTYFEVRKFGVEFIPATAKQCTAKEAGCEQFTNLDAPAAGGENIENYSRLRQCEKFGADAKTYFYWEGTDTGYQLNRFSLVKGLALSYSYTNKDGQKIDVSESGEPPKYSRGFQDYAGCNKEVFDSKTDPDCFELFDETGNRWYRKLSMTISSPNPDFYLGGVIPFEAACHNYRKSLSGELVCRLRGVCTDPAGCACSAGDLKCNVLQGEDSCSNDNSCINTGGRWQGGECLYQAIPKESVRCQAVGCKQYKGSTARNERNIIFDTFEKVDINPRWGSESGQISRSPVSLLYGGNSLKFKNTLTFDLAETCRLPVSCALREGCQCVTSNGNTCLVSRDQQSCSAAFVGSNRTYTAKFYIKHSTTLPSTASVKFGSSAANADLAIGSHRAITTDWSEVILGPLLFNRTPSPAEKLIIEVRVEQAPGAFVPAATDSYIDNVVIREERESHYLVENSWKTPNTCETDPPLTGGIAQTSMLGCKTYTDRFGRTDYLKSFKTLCPSNKVGCEAVVDTHNSASPYREVFNEGDPAQLVVPADSIEYVINDPNAYCAKESKACMAAGLPSLNQKDELKICDLGVTCNNTKGCLCQGKDISEFDCIVKQGSRTCRGWEEIFYLNDPDKYNQTLCKSAELWCEEFSDGSTLHYFKDPLDKICEYKAIPGTVPVQYAWFKTGEEISLGTANPAQCLCEFKSLLTVQERTCKLASACGRDGGCSCAITNELFSKGLTCTVEKLV